MPEQKKHPLLEANIRTEFGEVRADQLETGRSQDLTAVPGFTDMKIARDTEISEAFKTGRKANPIPLPVNLRWFRAMKPNGDSDAVKTTGAKVKGYRAVTMEDVGKHSWLTEMPAGAVKAADGTIRLGDTMLMVADQASAARNEATKMKNMLELANHQFDGGDLVDAGGEVRKIEGYSKAEVFKDGKGK